MQCTVQVPALQAEEVPGHGYEGGQCPAGEKAWQTFPQCHQEEAAGRPLTLQPGEVHHVQLTGSVQTDSAQDVLLTHHQPPQPGAAPGQRDV